MAYAAIICLIRTIHQSMQLTGCDLQQFYQKLESLRSIMEKSGYIITGDVEALTSLEAEIVELAYSAEDMVDLVSRYGRNRISRIIAPWILYYFLKRAVGRIDSTINKWIEMKKMYTKSTVSLKAKRLTLDSSTSQQHDIEPPENDIVMVGHENEFEMMLDQLDNRERELEVVSIVGMGGIGKTTLAAKLYSDQRIMSHFDIRAKATVSQDHCVRNVLLSLLCIKSNETDDELADRLQKLLKSKRYLVVIDDIWTTKAWDDIRQCFPDCNNGSRILLTTRDVEIAEYAATSGKPPNHMRLMNFNESWSLLYKKVFVNDCFPVDFERIGKQIAFKCRGLPLTITVIAGLLSKMGKNLNEWQSVCENVSTDVESQCMEVLALSYHHLPFHLKPCFLYFAIFPEDYLITADILELLWAVEGFLKVEEMKSTREVAEQCLKELADRCLISLVHSSFDGKIMSCGMHDVIRELCLKEAQNMNFVNVIGGGKSDQNRCRIIINNEEEWFRCSNSEAHSVIFRRFRCSGPEWELPLSFKLVRVLDLTSTCFLLFPSGILCLIHLRYLALALPPLNYLGDEPEEFYLSRTDIPPSISSLCYLQTFILRVPPSHDYDQCSPFILPSDILMLPQLRSLDFRWNYLQNHKPREKTLALKNLQCLSGWNPRYCTRSFFSLFPNLKKLNVRGIPEDFRISKDLYDFRYLDQLEELILILIPHHYNAVDINTPPQILPPFLLPPPDAFPQNVKSLTFNGCFMLPWKDLSIVGKLPKLESLIIEGQAFRGEEWEVADEEGFPHLKFLLLYCTNIKYWRASSDHFPCLERLVINECTHLDSIPQEFADITTLALIDITFGSQSLVYSAKQIQRDIQDNYGGSIDVHTRHTMIPWNSDRSYISERNVNSEAKCVSANDL